MFRRTQGKVFWKQLFYVFPLCSCVLVGILSIILDLTGDFWKEPPPVHQVVIDVTIAVFVYGICLFVVMLIITLPTYLVFHRSSRIMSILSIESLIACVIAFLVWIPNMLVR